MGQDFLGIQNLMTIVYCMVRFCMVHSKFVESKRRCQKKIAGQPRLMKMINPCALLYEKVDLTPPRMVFILAGIS